MYIPVSHCKFLSACHSLPHNLIYVMLHEFGFLMSLKHIYIAITLILSNIFAHFIYFLVIPFYFFRQKQSIFQLQQQLLVQTNTAMQQAVPAHYHLSRSHSTGDNNSLALKLQECQYENAQLRAHLAEKDSSLDKLQKKLG